MNDLRPPHEPQPCEPWAERLSLAASGCLSPDEEREVRRHIETCPACRERFRRLTELCGVLVESCVPDESPEAAVVSRVMSAIAGDESRQPPDCASAETAHPTFPTRLQTTWRWIMRSSRFSRDGRDRFRFRSDRNRAVVPRKRDGAGFRRLPSTDSRREVGPIQDDHRNERPVRGNGNGRRHVAGRRPVAIGDGDRNAERAEVQVGAYPGSATGH